MKIFDLFKRKNKAKFKKVFVIVNPIAGGPKLVRYEKLLKNFFSKYKISYSYKVTSKPAEAIQLAKNAAKEKYELVIAAGGDGTINEVVNGIINSKSILGIIPLGTINILAMELGIPQNFTKALNLILTGSVKAIDIGKVNDRYFVLMAGFGMDSYAIYRTNLKLKKYIGALAYVISGIYSIFKYPPHKISVNIDNHRIDDTGYFVVVENVPSYGGKFKIAPYADVNDGLLDVCVFKKTGIFHTFRYFLGIALKKHIHYPDVRYYQCKKVELASNHNVLVHTDGDVIGSLPAQITVLRKKLKVLVPEND